ncbi:unnamed protein product [Mucor circinelloides]
MPEFWEPIASRIIDKLIVKDYDFSTKANRRLPSSALSVSTPTSALATKSLVVPTEESFDNDSGPVKLTKLTDSDKQNIKKMYAGLDKNKMWRLSAGTVVEEKMRDFALRKDHEHLCHSLIFDVKDKCWTEYFSPDEVLEIQEYKSVNLPPVPNEMQFYLNQLKDVEAQDLYEAVISKKFGLESNGKWVQDCFYDCIRLLRSDFFPLTNVLEAGIVKRMWSCLDACFDFSAIKCISGEKCSKSSADAINANRTSILTRQSCGQKMDYLFTINDNVVEIGCGECALVGGVNTTKELCDASFKMPKVMKAMAVNLVSKSPDMKDKLAIAGFYIGDDKLTLLVLDCPTKYVTRYDRFSDVFYPRNEDRVCRYLPAVLKVIMGGRMIMEDTMNKFANDKTDVAIGKENVVDMIPCFASTSINSKKRKL